mgnify:CR=1 FL=1
MKTTFFIFYSSSFLAGDRVFLGGDGDFLTAFFGYGDGDFLLLFFESFLTGAFLGEGDGDGVFYFALPLVYDLGASFVVFFTTSLLVIGNFLTSSYLQLYHLFLI